MLGNLEKFKRSAIFIDIVNMGICFISLKKKYHHGNVHYMFFKHRHLILLKFAQNSPTELKNKKKKKQEWKRGKK